MDEAELKDTVMRMAIIGKVVDLESIEVCENSRSNSPAAEPASTSAVAGSVFPRLPSVRFRVYDPRSNQTTSYVRGRVVGTSPDQPENPETPPPVATPGPLNIDIESTSSFVPVRAFSQFPKKYIYDEGQENYITQHWFEKFWDRSWDLFCLPAPGGANKTGSILLIPELQAQNMLTEINVAIKERLSLTGMEQDRLVLRFDKAGTTKPPYLGKATNLQEKQDVERNLSALRDFAVWENLTKGWSDEALAAFEEKMIEANSPTNQTGGSRSKRARASKAQKQAQLRVEMQSQLTKVLGRLLEWLGLRRFGTSPQNQPLILHPVNVLMAPEWPFHGDVVFVAIDCEWMERSRETLTEVGLSILDTRDLANLSPGDYGVNWKKKIQSHHLRVSEYQYHVNNEFCEGCPDKFDWGKSAIIDKDMMGKAIDTCLDKNRNIILVGLSMKRDMELIGHTGSEGFGWFQYANDSGSHYRLDVADLFRALRGTGETLGMVRLLNEMNETHTGNLHNAGNDARCTMHLLIRIALEAAGEKPETEGRVELGWTTQSGQPVGWTSYSL